MYEYYDNVTYRWVIIIVSIDNLNDTCKWLITKHYISMIEPTGI